MKKSLLSLLISSAIITVSAQTATNFTTNDCTGASHTLFTELDAGKVIVMCWVMPCATCIAPASTDAATVQSFASSHPGRVKFYLLDDNGGTTCTTLNSWANTNSITADATFQNAGNAVKMTDYGTAGMPKTVVLGGTSHTVFYNTNGSVSSTALQSAITNALNSTTGIAEQEYFSSLNLFPNPADSRSEISYTLNASSNVKIEVYNIVGEKAATVFSGFQNAGEQSMSIDTQKLSNGIYFVKLTSGSSEKTIKLSVAH